MANTENKYENIKGKRIKSLNYKRNAIKNEYKNSA